MGFFIETLGLNSKEKSEEDPGLRSSEKTTGEKEKIQILSIQIVPSIAYLHSCLSNFSDASERTDSYESLLSEAVFTFFSSIRWTNNLSANNLSANDNMNNNIMKDLEEKELKEVVEEISSSSRERKQVDGEHILVDENSDRISDPISSIGSPSCADSQSTIMVERDAVRNFSEITLESKSDVYKKSTSSSSFYWKSQKRRSSWNPFKRSNVELAGVLFPLEVRAKRGSKLRIPILFD